MASVEQWQKLEDEWGDVLAGVGLNCFHMMDFAHSKREFKSWRGDERRRMRFLQRLTSIVSTRVRKSFSSVVILKDYKALDKKFRLHETVGHPYAFCGHVCAEKVRNWAREYRVNEPIEIVFETGSRHKGELMDILTLHGLSDPIFRKKQEHSALQAADLVAWEHLKVCTEIEGKRRISRIRKSLDALRAVPNDWALYRSSGLEMLCKNLPVPLRSAGGEKISLGERVYEVSPCPLWVSTLLIRSRS